MRQMQRDKAEVKRIRATLNSPTGYSRMEAGVHAYDVAEMSDDMRMLLRIASRLLRAEGEKGDANG